MRNHMTEFAMDLEENSETKSYTYNLSLSSIFKCVDVLRFWTHFCWELRAKASCFSLEIPNFSATFSEVTLKKQRKTYKDESIFGLYTI